MVFTTAKSSQKIQTILDQNQGVAVLNFFKKSSEQEQYLDPYILQLNAQSDIPLLKIDMENSQNLSKNFNVDENIPSFVVVKDKWNNMIHVVSGTDKESIQKAFQAAAHNRRHQPANMNFMD